MYTEPSGSITSLLSMAHKQLPAAYILNLELLCLFMDIRLAAQFEMNNISLIIMF